MVKLKPLWSTAGHQRSPVLISLKFDVKVNSLGPSPMRPFPSFSNDGGPMYNSAGGVVR